jgi:hypothetical protein
MVLLLLFACKQSPLSFLHKAFPYSLLHSPCYTLVLTQDAVKAWGVRQLTLLDAEDRLSLVTEKGVTQDPVILAMREVYQVGEKIGQEGGGTSCNT